MTGKFDYSLGEPITLDIHKPPLTKRLMANRVTTSEWYREAPTAPKLTIQVTAYNEGDALLDCLNSIIEQSCQDFEIVLVDNGLDAQTRNKLKQYNLLHVISESNLGCCGGRNVGATYCRAPLMAFVDGDGILHQDFVASAIDIMADPSIVAVRGQVLPHRDKDSKVPSHYTYGEVQLPSYIDTEGASVWRRERYCEAGGFEEALAGGEGVVLCYRLRELFGVPVGGFQYNPSLILYHDYHVGHEELDYKIRRQAINNVAIHNRYPLMRYMLREYSAALADHRQPEPEEVKAKARQYKKEVEFALARAARARRTNPKGGHPKISAIVTNYNHRAELEKTLFALTEQSASGVEIIVVDDASTHQSTQEKLDELSHRVKIIRHESTQGLATARNTGIEAASAPLIVCFEPGEIVSAHYLEQACNVFEIGETVGLVTSQATFHGDTGGKWQGSPSIDVTNLLTSPLPGPTCFRKKLWQEHGGFDTAISSYDQWDFWLRVHEGGQAARVIPEQHIAKKVHFRYNENIDVEAKRFFEKHEKLFQDNVCKLLANAHRTIHLKDQHIVKLRNREVLRRRAYKLWQARTKLLNEVRVIQSPSDALALAKKGADIGLRWVKLRLP